jgi:hypothetical protein
MITKRRKRKFNTTFFSKKWASYRLYRKRPPRIVNQTVPKIIAISVHTVNHFPLNWQEHLLWICDRLHKLYKSKLIVFLYLSKNCNYIIHSHLSKVFGNVKKSLCNQPKPYFFKKLLWSHFWINFNIFYTKTFGIVYISFVYLLIMFIFIL